MKSKSQSQKHAYWKEHIQKWEESGLSQPSYCEAQRLKLTTFSYYRHRYLNSGTAIEPSVKFVAVEPKAAHTSQPIAALQLMLPNGIRIGVSQEVNEPLLKMVLNVAGQVVC